MAAAETTTAEELDIQQQEKEKERERERERERRFEHLFDASAQAGEGAVREEAGAGEVQERKAGRTRMQHNATAAGA